MERLVLDSCLMELRGRVDNRKVTDISSSDLDHIQNALHPETDEGQPLPPATEVACRVEVCPARARVIILGEKVLYLGTYIGTDPLEKVPCLGLPKGAGSDWLKT